MSHPKHIKFVEKEEQSLEKSKPLISQLLNKTEECDFDNDNYIAKQKKDNYFMDFDESKINDDDNNNKKNASSCVKKERLMYLDVFRGITLFYMILVNLNIDNNQIYWFFTESDWNGFMPADCIFPTFLFIMGVSMVLKNNEVTQKKIIQFFHILKRALILFFLGFLLNLQIINFYNLENLRIMGVLQRLGITYFLGGLLHLIFSEFYFFKKKLINNKLHIKSEVYYLLPKKRSYIYANYGFFIQILVIMIFLLSYSYFAYCLKIPECGKGKIEKICFAGSYIDRIVFGKKHIWVEGEYEPEGLVSTLTSVYPVFIGYFYGKLLNNIKKLKQLAREKEETRKKSISMFNRAYNNTNKFPDIESNSNNNITFPHVNMSVQEYKTYNINLTHGNNETNPQGIFQVNINKSLSKTEKPIDTTEENLQNYLSEEDEILLSEKLTSLDYLLLYYWLALSIFNLLIGIFFKTFFNIEFNKKAYTLSFAFLVCGASGFGLTILHLLLDLIKAKAYKKYFVNRFFAPFKFLGMNSLVVFCGSSFYTTLLDKNIKFTIEEYGDTPVSLYKLFYDKLFFAIFPNNPQLAQFFLSLFAGILFILITALLYYKKCFVKI